MGACCGNRSLITENEAENFVRAILHSLKLRSFSYSEVTKSFRGTMKTEVRKVGDKEKEIITFVEEEYEVFIENTFYEKEKKINPYYKFHEKLAPSYEEVVDDNLFEYNFSIFCLSLYDTSEKFELLNQIFKSLENNKITVEIFQEFLSKYLKINLLLFTNRISSVINEYKDLTLVGDKMIDKVVKRKFKEIEEKLYNQKNLSIFEKDVFGSLEELLKNNKSEEKRIFPGDIIKTNQMKIFFDKHPFLLDALELRSAFYLRFYKNE